MFKSNKYLDGKVKSLAFQATGERFDVPGDSAVDLRVLADSAYLCLYG